MFEVTSHDFGDVARGAKAEFHFKLKNSYKEDVHISSVRTSCECTTPSITKQTLKTHEEAAIVAKFNTRSHTGNQSASLTVVFDKPYYAEVQLHVNGHIRGDVVFNPGVIAFGAVDEGTVATQKVDIKYAGRSDWQIVDVRSANEFIEVEMTQTERGIGRVAYQLLVRLKADAPAGYLNDQLILVTNDRNSRQIPLVLEGRVVPSITVSPASLSMGTLEPGQEAVKQVVVRGKSPFKIVDITCTDESFQFDVPEEAKTLHVIPVTFTAGQTPGRIVRKIEIQTDQNSESVTTIVVSATVKATTSEPDDDSDGTSDSDSE